LITSTRRTRNPKFVPIDPKERLGKYVKYKALFFYSDLFFPGLAYWSDPWTDFYADVSNYAQSRKEVLFWGLHNGRKDLGGQSPPKPSKLGVNMLCRASQLRVNDDW